MGKVTYWLWGRIWDLVFDRTRHPKVVAVYVRLLDMGVWRLVVRYNEDVDSPMEVAAP